MRVVREADARPDATFPLVDRDGRAHGRLDDATWAVMRKWPGLPAGANRSDYMMTDVVQRVGATRPDGKFEDYGR